MLELRVVDPVAVLGASRAYSFMWNSGVVLLRYVAGRLRADDARDGRGERGQSARRETGCRRLSSALTPHTPQASSNNR